jgi:hypothetical protein
MVDSILKNKELQKDGIVGYDIYLSNEEGKVLWKTIQDMPVIIENNINFE